MSVPLGLNAGLTSVLGALGQRLDPYLSVNFLVEIEGLVVGGFSKVDGLESTIETQDYVEGGRNDFVHKILKGQSARLRWMSSVPGMSRRKRLTRYKPG